MKYRYTIPMIAAWLIIPGSCSKSTFLLENPSGNFVKPETLAHCQALLNNAELLNTTPVQGEQSANDYYCLPAYYDGLTGLDQRLYTWQKELYGNMTQVPDWNKPYEQLYVLNLVLETLAGITPDVDSVRQQWRYCKGYALFMRSYVFHNLAQLFAPEYDAGTAGATPGIVLPLQTKWTTTARRESLAITYEQIIAGLQEARDLVPEGLPVNYRHLPGRLAVYAMLARVYLTMRNYRQAGMYADSCLQQYDVLMDFNTLRYPATGEKFLIPVINTETLYRSWMIEGNLIGVAVFRNSIIDSTLYGEYEPNDLRKKIYFGINAQGLPYMRNGYSGSIYAFSGLAIDEVLLMRAECLAVQGNTIAALAHLDRLLVKRYVTNTYVNKQVTDSATAVAMVRAERRKELIYRGLRWPDLRRYNKEGAGITLQRVVHGQPYQLLPGSRNYTLPIPANVLQGTAIEQNIRE